MPTVPSRSRRIAVALVGVLLLFPIGSGVVAGQSFEGASDTVVVDEDETYENVAGVTGTIIVRGTVTGDVAGAAGTIHVTDSGRVGGGEVEDRCVVAPLPDRRPDPLRDFRRLFFAGAVDDTERCQL